MKFEAIDHAVNSQVTSYVATCLIIFLLSFYKLISFYKLNVASRLDAKARVYYSE